LLGLHRVCDMWLDTYRAFVERYWRGKSKYLEKSPPQLSFFFLSCGATAQIGPRLPLFGSSYTTIRHTTLGRTSLDEGSARRRDLHLTTNSIHNRQTSMPPVGFEPTIPASARRQTHALVRAATGIGTQLSLSTTNTILNGLRLKPFPRGNRLPANCLSHGNGYKPLCCRITRETLCC
jgi:hypothetical protein